MVVVKESLAKENADLTKRIAAAEGGRKRLEEDLAQRAAAGEKQLAEERVSSQAREAELKTVAAKSAENRKQLAMELAIFQTREAELIAGRREDLLDNDQLKARLDDQVKINRSLEEEKKNVDDQWHQSLQKIDALQSELGRKQGVFSKEQKERETRISRLSRSLQAAQNRLGKLEGLKAELTEEVKAPAGAGGFYQQAACREIRAGSQTGQGGRDGGARDLHFLPQKKKRPRAGFFFGQTEAGHAL
jgi:DNA repair exonuclease SbcCD ATPase subunit